MDGSRWNQGRENWQIGKQGVWDSRVEVQGSQIGLWNQRVYEEEDRFSNYRKAMEKREVAQESRGGGSGQKEEGAVGGRIIGMGDLKEIDKKAEELLKN